MIEFGASDDVGVAEAVADATAEYRSPLPRLTTRVFRDLAIWMTGLGLVMGVLFPFFVVALGVPARYAFTARFFVATTVAGLIVGAANHFLSRLVVGSRLRFMRAKMSTVELLLYQSSLADTDNPCTPEACAIRVDSDDELGDVLSSFNRLVAAQAASHQANDLASRFASILSSHIEVVPLTGEALAHIHEATGVQASALCIRSDGALATIASNGIVDPASLGQSELVGQAFRTLEVVELSLSDELLLDAGVVTFRPRQVFAFPLHIRRVPIGVLLLASTEIVPEPNRALVQRFMPGLAVALDNALSHERLQLVAAIDEVTGLRNRRSGLERLSDAVDRSVRTNEQLGVVLFDIDHFKNVNDTYGHQVGDEVLNAVAKAAQSVLRQGDTLMRYGGEEFLAVLPAAGGDDIRRLGERLRRVVESTAVQVGQLQVGVTISLGAASFPSEHATDLDDLIRHADSAMYESKESGRNKLTFVES